MNHYMADLLERHPALGACQEQIEQAFHVLAEIFERGGKLLLCGNGGSAADCEHWSGELLKGFCSRRPLDVNQSGNMPQTLSGSLQQALPAIPLTSFSSLLSAFGNDVDAHYGYAQLVWALGEAGDALVGISTSGNAQNVRAAMLVAESKGLRCIGLTGKNGGALAGMCEVCIRVPESETYKVQELHLPVYHALCMMLEDKFFENA